MTKIRLIGFAAGLSTAFALVGCSSDSSGCADGGDASCTSATSDGSTDAGDGPLLYGFTKAGDSCFEVTAVAPGSVDGCMIGVADATMAPALTVILNYASSTGTVTLGKMGALGAGQISNNKGTLVRDGDTSITGNTACMFHQTDTTQFELIANDTFTVGVTEVQSGFGAVSACSADYMGVTDPCTSTWKWTMAKSTKLPPCI